jgi:hypothetical protein
MIRDTLLVFRTPDRLIPALPAILGGAGIEIIRDSVRWKDNGIEAEAAPRAFSWWGEHVAVYLHPDEGGTTVVEIVSSYKGMFGWMDFDNVWKIRAPFKRMMTSLGVDVAWTHPRVN